MNYSEMDTPAVLIDLAVTEKNIKTYQKYCNDK
jgi:D-serine deaminase-like pyridoxal phosphate-dependent protein